ncbi:MAG: YdcF family protein [Gammaproteobacteria bacterium]|nr:YdcF family protein [Gammaproteobacteria bacterium]
MITFLYIIKSLILPPGIFIVLLILSLIFWKKRRLAITLISITLISIYLLSTPFIAVELAKPLQPKPISIQQLSHAQAIVILGAGRDTNSPKYGADNVSKLELSYLRYAAYLRRQTKLPILTSGGSVFGKRTPEATLMAKTLKFAFNTPVKWQETTSKNTKQNAQSSIAILKKNNIKSIVLITSAIHMPRSVLAFKSYKINVIPAATNYITLPKFSAKILNFLPNMKYYHRSKDCLYEYFGLAWHYFHR